MWKSTRKKTITIFTEKSTFFREISVLTKELISRKIFENDFVFHTVKEKSTFTKELIWRNIFFGETKFFTFPHCAHTVLCLTNFFREINYLVHDSWLKLLFSRIFCQKNVRDFFNFQHCTYVEVDRLDFAFRTKTLEQLYILEEHEFPFQICTKKVLFY